MLLLLMLILNNLLILHPLFIKWALRSFYINPINFPMIVHPPIINTYVLKSIAPPVLRVSHINSRGTTLLLYKFPKG